MSFFKKLRAFFSFQTLGRLSGSNIVATSFFLGYLPEWSRHWSAFFSIIFSIILLYNTVSIPLQEAEMAYILIIEFIYGFLIANIMTPIFRKAFPLAKLENVTIDAFLAQVLVLALCVPAIFYVNSAVIGSITKLCTSFLNCSNFIFDAIVIFVTLLSPYFILRFFDSMEFWPTSKMFLYAEMSFNRIFAGICPAIYSILAIYLISFLIFDLTLISVLEFYSVVFHKVYIHLLLMTAFLLKILNMKTIYIFFRKIGIIGLLDKYGFLSMAYYDSKYIIRS